MSVSSVGPRRLIVVDWRPPVPEATSKHTRRVVLSEEQRQFVVDLVKQDPLHSSSLDIERKTGFPRNLIAAQLQRSGLSNKASRVAFAARHGWTAPKRPVGYPAVCDPRPRDSPRKKLPEKPRDMREAAIRLKVLLRAVDAIESGTRP